MKLTLILSSQVVAWSLNYDNFYIIWNSNEESILWVLGMDWHIGLDSETPRGLGIFFASCLTNHTPKNVWHCIFKKCKKKKAKRRHDNPFFVLKLDWSSSAPGITTRVTEPFQGRTPPLRKNRAQIWRPVYGTEEESRHKTSKNAHTFLLHQWASFSVRRSTSLFTS